MTVFLQPTGNFNSDPFEKQDRKAKKRGKPSNMQLYGKDSVRLRFGDGNIVLGLDPQMDALFEKINSLERGTKFRTVAMWLLTGAMMEVALPVDQVDEMRKAAEEIMSNFVVD